MSANTTATNTTATNTTATNTTATANGSSAPGPPVEAGGGPPGFVESASNGLDVAAKMAGDAIRQYAPQFVQDLVPFLDLTFNFV